MRHIGRGFLRVPVACIILFLLALTPAKAGWFEELFGLQTENQPAAAPTVRLPKRAPIPTPRPKQTSMIRSAILPMPIGDPAGLGSFPTGHIAYCQRYPQDCGPNDMISLVVLDELVINTLIAVNRAVNEQIKPMTDPEQYGRDDWWEYPTSGYGDCEDYVLEKRRRLIGLGFPPSSLLITYVEAVNEAGALEGHVVLTVAGTYGDLVLDSLIPEVLPWQYVPYRFISRQSPWDAGAWELIGQPETGLVASAE